MLVDRLIVRSRDPVNAETPAAELIARAHTPQSLFYIRSHGAIPALDTTHRVPIGGLVERPYDIALADLQTRFAVYEVEATLQCAGNRRADLQRVRATAGDPWDVGAIGHARWTGVRLADLLAEAGIRDGARHVRATCADTAEVDGQIEPYGISIPIAKATSPEVIVAWAMNGEPLTPDHGAPLRLIVPGYAGVRSAKWLTAIDVAATPHELATQARDYKLFAPDVRKEDVDWQAGLTIDAMPVTSAICRPVDGTTIDAGPVEVQGYAVAFGRGVARVDVSGDGGRTWRRADLLEDGGPWCWRRWTASLSLGKGEHRLVVRAIDCAGQSQPEDASTVWNFAGYLSTAWHRITVIAA